MGETLCAIGLAVGGFLMYQGDDRAGILCITFFGYMMFRLQKLDVERMIGGLKAEVRDLDEELDQLARHIHDEAVSSRNVNP